MTELNLKEINRKLDLIINAFGLDGKKTSMEIKHDVVSIACELRERQLTKKKKKDIRGACQ